MPRTVIASSLTPRMCVNTAPGREGSRSAAYTDMTSGKLSERDAASPSILSGSALAPAAHSITAPPSPQRRKSDGSASELSAKYDAQKVRSRSNISGIIAHRPLSGYTGRWLFPAKYAREFPEAWNTALLRYASGEVGITSSGSAVILCRLKA